MYEFFYFLFSGKTSIQRIPTPFVFDFLSILLYTKIQMRQLTTFCAVARASSLNNLRPFFKPRFIRSSRVRSLRRNSEPASVTRGNSRVLKSPATPKKDALLDVLFLAQKTRFELVLRFSHTTPLAGEPLEPLGYFCMAQYSKAILLYHIFFALSKLFALKNKKSSQIFLKRLTESRLSFIIPYVKIF